MNIQLVLKVERELEFEEGALVLLQTFYEKKRKS